MSRPLKSWLRGLVVLAVGFAMGWIGRGWSPFSMSVEATGGHSGTSTARSKLAPPPPASIKAGSSIEVDDTALSPARRYLKNAIAAQEGDKADPFEKFTADQFATYLDRHRRDASSLLAVWHLTQDDAVLREAYEKFPNDLQVARRAFVSLPLSEAERQSLVQRIEKEHPNNALSSVLAGSERAKEGDTAGAVEKMREALARPNIDIHTWGQSLATREALMSLGKSPLEAKVQSYFMVGEPIVFQFMDLSHAASTQIKSMLESNDTNSALTLSGELMAFGQRIAQMPDNLLLTEILGRSIESQALAGLPADVEIGDTGRTPAEQLALLKERNAQLALGVGTREWHLTHLDEPGLELYFQIMEQRGEREALKWAETYHGPPPP